MQDGISRRPESQSVRDARRAIEESRARMADTLNAIEHRIVSKKDEIEQKMDVMRPVKRQVRARPWPALAVAFGVGVMLWKLRRD